MKKLIWLAVLSVVIFACNKSDKNQYTINGNMEGISDGWVVLNKVSDNDLKAVDSVEAKNGQFTFTGTIEAPEVYYLNFTADKKYHRFFLEPGTITISGTLDQPVFDGSQAQAVFDAFTNQMKQFDERASSLGQQYQQARTSGDADKIKSLEDEFEKLDTEQREFILQFAKDHGSSVVSPYIVSSNIYMFDLDQMQQVMASLDSTISNSKYVVQLQNHINKLQNVEVGKEAPVFTQDNPDGQPVSLKDFRGKYLLIDFWASWCKPCRAENPNVVAAYQKYHDKGFDVLGVSLDRNKEAWIKAINDDHLVWTQVSDLKYWNNEASDLYAVSSIPANFLLDPQGVIVAKNLRGDKLEEKLEEVLD